MTKAIILALEKHNNLCNEKLEKLIQKMPLMPILDKRSLKAYTYLASSHAALEEEERGHKKDIMKNFQKANDSLVHFWEYIEPSRKIGCESKACIVDENGLPKILRILEDRKDIDQEVEKCKAILSVTALDIGYLPLDSRHPYFAQIKTSVTPKFDRTAYRKK